MRIFLLAFLCVSLTATTAEARKPPRLSANPSAVIAAELAFAQLAQAKGQWSAFAATSTDDATMFVPQPVNAHQYLKRKPNPMVAVKWQPHRVWSSCDGTFGVTTGAWQLPNVTGYFSTVWQRQKDETYKWVMDGGDALAAPLAAPEFVPAKVASCTRSPVAGAPTPLPGPGWVVGQSPDASLNWAAKVEPDGARTFSVRFWNGAGYEEVLHQSINAPPAG